MGQACQSLAVVVLGIDWWFHSAWELGIHALPFSAGIVDEFGFSDLSEDAIVAKDSRDPPSEYWRGVLCVCRHDMFVEL